MRILTKSAAETKKTASLLAEEARRILRSHTLSHALVFSLEGELGSGKTTFVQGFARGFNVKERITSPTYVLMKRYSSPPHLLYHIDCYRLKSAKDLAAIGFGDALCDRGAVVLAEWGDRVRRILPKHRFVIRFTHVGRHKNEHRITVLLPWKKNLGKRP